MNSDSPGSEGPQHGSDRDHGQSGVYAAAAATVGLALIWFAVWTLLCNAAVLAGLHYDRVFPWGLLAPTLITAFAGWRWWGSIARSYSPSADIQEVRGSVTWLGGAIGVAAAVAAAAWAFQSLYPVLIVGAAVVGFLLSRSAQPAGGAAAHGGDDAAGWRVLLLFMVLLAIYYFGHRADEDDAVFVNLAVGAQRTLGGVFELDTIMGDGPTLIHLPTYKFHSFELLAASISSATGLEPITVFHLLLPLPQLALIALIFFLILVPVCRRYWLVAALLCVAFLMLGRGYSSWGAHGIFRLIHGKAFLVTALVPLIAALTTRWFRSGRRTDLIGLALAQACAVGFTANGLYVGPAASGFVAAAFVAASPGTWETWRRALSLVPTLIYPVLVIGAVALLDLARPSQLHDVFLPLQQLAEVAGGGGLGFLIFPLILLAGLGLAGTRFRKAGFIYIPLALALTCNPLGWHLISEATGNLGFRIFWALPVAMLAGMTGLTLMRWLGLRSEVLMLVLAGLGLTATIALNAFTAPPAARVRWHLPDLKVNRLDYDLAASLAERTTPGCSILAPERIATWLPTMRNAPPPVYSREVYLLYPFTLSPEERELRIRLRLLVQEDSDPTTSGGAMPAGGAGGPGSGASEVSLVAPPTAQELARHRIAIGTVAVDRASPVRASASLLAQNLGLAGPVALGDLLVWNGQCGGGQAPAAATGAPGQ